MPERDFELYLSVLSRLLRLSPEQTAAISDELRDHLEERFEELVRSGINRDDAIRQALDEFGDAAGMAGEFTKLSRKRLRGLVMKSTLAVSVVAALAAFLLKDWQPERDPLPGPGQIAAQGQADQPATGDAEAAGDADLTGNSSELVLVLEGDSTDLPQLQESATVHFLEIPLEDALNFLATEHEFSFILHTAALNELGISPDVPLTLKLGTRPDSDRRDDDPAAAPPTTDSLTTNRWQVSLEQTLTQMLEPLELSWFVEDRILHITTADVANDRQFPRSYDVSRLMASGMTPDTLREAVIVASGNQWEERDGTGGRLAQLGNVLTVAQTDQSHRDIESLLRALVERGTRRIVRSPAAHQVCLDTLQRHVKDVNFVDTPLEDVVVFLEDAADTPILIDRLVLDENGVPIDSPVNLRVANQTLGSVLKLALEPIGCKVTIRHGLLTVTTGEMADENLVAMLYDIRDFGNGTDEVHELLHAIETTTQGHWVNWEGQGGALVAPGGGRLIVRQTEGVQRQIARLLAAQRFAVRTRAGADATTSRSDAADPTLETRSYRMPLSTAEDLLTVLPQSVAQDSWLDARSGVRISKVAVGQKFIPLPGHPASPTAAGKTTGQSTDTPNKANKSEKTAETQHPDVLVVPEAVLVIRQSRTVHREIDRFLRTIGVESSGAVVGGGYGGGGFGFGGGFGGGFF